MRCITAIVAAMVILLVLGTPLAKAQQTHAPASAPATSQPGDKPLLKPEQLEQLLAAIALYPDPLITQILMASTYPLEVVQADRWAKAHKDLKGDALAKELEALPYDPSVKSLINFPEVLAMMSEKLDLTQQIGDAFIAQQADVMNTIQKLRAMANAEGQLKSNEQQKVTVVQAPPTAPDTTIIVQQPPPTQVITIQPTQPEVIYVPSYNPTVVYGAWPYPYYPPAPYYPPGYVASNVMSFGVGVACGAAWGYAWGNSNWGRGSVDIDINRNTNFNRNIDRSKHQQNISNRQNNRGSGSGGRNSWQHDPGHRGGVPYSDRKTANQYGRGDARASQAREQYRGRADAGRQDLARGGADGARGSGANAGRGNAGQNSGRGTASQTPARGGSSAANRPSQTGGSAANRGSASSGNRGGAFNGAGSSGSSARASSQRGQASRSSGGSRSGGGGSRGGGGGSRGGGGGGGRGRSDVNVKTDFASVDAQTILEKVLALPITSWTYNDDPTSRHLGPMAQDFYRSFGIGTDDKTITFLDEGGVALSAIQGLNQKLEEKDARIQLLEKEVAELKALVQALAKTAGVRTDAEQQAPGK